MNTYGITRQLIQKKEKHIVLPSSALKKENIYVPSVKKILLLFDVIPTEFFNIAFG